MPGEQGQDLPKSPQGDMQERIPQNETFSMRMRRIAERALRGSKPEPTPVMPEPVEAVDPEQEQKPKGWLFDDENELEGLDPGVHVALRQAERVSGRTDGMAGETLRGAYLRIDAAVFDDKVDLDKVRNYQGKIAQRIEEIDKGRAVPVQLEPQAPQTINIDTSPIANVVAEGHRQASRAQDSLRETLERQGEELKRVAESIRDRAEAPAPDFTPIVEALSKTSIAVKELPTEEAEQRAHVREILDKIERGRYPLGHGTNSDDYKMLQGYEGKLLPEIAREVRARLRLHDCFAVTATIAGKTEDMIAAYRNVGSELTARNHLIEGEDLQLLLKEGLPEMHVREVFDGLQRIPFREAQGDSPYPPGVKELIDRYGIESVRLAKNLGVVLFESSVWNEEADGVDPLAEAIWLKNYRTGRQRKGRDSGPDSTRDVVDCVGTSFLRHVVTFEKANKATGILQQLKAKIEASPNDNQLKDDAAELVIKIRREDFLDLDRIDFTKFKANEYAIWLSSTLPKMITAKELILKENWESKEISEDVVEKWIDVFNSAADPDGYLGLKAYFVVGVLDQGIRKGISTGWGDMQTKDAIDAFSAPTGVDEDDNPISFLNKREMQWVKDVVKPGRRGLLNEFVMNLRDAQRIRRR